MLRHLYRENPQKLELVLNNLLDGQEPLPVGVTFKQQIKSANSRPDGRITQVGWDLQIEVKPGDNWNLSQLNNHIRGFKNTQNKYVQNFLLLLSTDKDARPQVTIPEGMDVELVTTTFETLLEAIEQDNVVASHEVGLLEIVEDFRSILASNDLLPNPYRLYAFNCFGSMEENLEGKLYYEPADRPSKLHVLNGFYAGKRIQAIGRADFVIEAECGHSAGIDKDSFSAHSGNDAKLADAISWVERQNFLHMFDGRMRFYRYGTNFIDMEREGISFSKDTRGGYMGGVWLDLSYWFAGAKPSEEDLSAMVKLIDGKTFGKTRGFS